MKKPLVILLAVMLTFSIASCSTKDVATDKSDAPPAEETPTGVVTPTEETPADETPTIEVGGDESMKMAPEYRTMPQDEAHDLMQNDSSVIIVDVRTQQEYDEGHIANSLHIPDFEIRDRAEEMLPDKNATIIVYCRSGNRSKSATMELNVLGYTKVYDIGGLNDWKYDIVK